MTEREKIERALVGPLHAIGFRLIDIDGQRVFAIPERDAFKVYIEPYPRKVKP